VKKFFIIYRGRALNVSMRGEREREKEGEREGDGD
jgi:hypothetical protein